MLHKLKPVPRAIIIGAIVAGGVFAFTKLDLSSFKQKPTAEQSAPPAPPVTTVPPAEQAPVAAPVNTPAPVQLQPSAPAPAEPAGLQSAPSHDAGLANVLGGKK